MGAVGAETVATSRSDAQTISRLDVGLQDTVSPAYSFGSDPLPRLVPHPARGVQTVVLLPARRWLDRLRGYHPSTDPDEVWDELEIRLLRSETEAVILYDLVFPADPFARGRSRHPVFHLSHP
jgi:hypothetical protein